MHGSISPRPRRSRLDFAIIIGLALLILAAVLGPQLHSVYPFTYDEMVYLRKTRAYDEWLRASLSQPFSLFSAEAVGRAEALRDMHPGFVKLVGLLPHWAMQAALRREGGARATGALFLAVVAAALYWFLVPRNGRWVALLAAVGLASLPRVFAHAHFHALDLPIMAMSFLAAVCLRRAALTDNWRAAIAAALVFGCALATKLNALVLVPHLALWAVLYRPPGWRKALAASVAVAPPVFVLLWPWLWHDLPAKLAQYAAFHAEHYHIPVYYLGRIYTGAQVAPWHYPLVMLATTLPLAWFVFLLGGLARVRLRHELETFLALGLLSNLAPLMLPGVSRYNGERLIMPCFVYAVALAVLACAALLRRLRKPHLLQVAAAMALTAWLLGANLAWINVFYPYCLSFYSEGIGGLAGAQRLGLEATYWGESFAGASSFMSRSEHAGQRFYASNELATGTLDALIPAGRIPPRQRMLGCFIKDRLPSDADWLIVDNSPAMTPTPIAKLMRRQSPIYQEQRQGVALISIYQAHQRR